MDLGHQNVSLHFPYMPNTYKTCDPIRWMVVLIKDFKTKQINK